MNCAECRELLVGFLEGLVDQAEKERVREHIRSCAGCTAELEKLEKLHKSLISNGEALGESDFEAEVFNRILREQKEKLKDSGQAGQTINVWRMIMKSPIIKLAAAAVIIAAVLFFFTQPGSVALADVAKKVRQFDTLIQQEQRSVYAIGQTEPGFITNAKKYVSTDYGSVEEQYDPQGNHITTTYLLKKEQKIITLMHEAKMYFVITLKGTALELPEGIDARSLVECIVTEQNPKKLGRKKIDGRTAEGFEAVNPEAMAKLSEISGGIMPLGDSTWRLWIDVETKLPIKIEGDLIFEEGPLTGFIKAQMKFETTSLEWGAEIDDSIFDCVIPDDYTLVDASNFTK
jgi:hypothetical protein